MLNKKELETIAAVFAQFRQQTEKTAAKPEWQGDTHITFERAAHTVLASNLALALQGINPRFDAQGFIEACGVR